MQLRARLWTCLMLLCVASVVHASDLAPVWQRHSKLATRLMAESHLVGYAVAVSVRGELVWEQGFGLADIENDVPVTAETLFRVASVSKTLTSAAVGQLHEQGKLDLDAPIQIYVPSFPRQRYDITLRQLGGHLAGIRHYRGNEMLSAVHYPDVVSGLAIFATDTLLFEPGTQFAYSSYGWNLISAALETAGGMPFLDYMRVHVFEPAAMHRTVPDLAPPLLPHRASFYDVSEDGTITNAPYVDNSYKWAGGGFLSTASDLVRFGVALWDARLVRSETLALLLASQTTRDGTPTHYGIGWRTDMDRVGLRGLRPYDEALADEAEARLQDARVVGHTGGAVGGRSLFFVAPEHGIVVAALSNCNLRPDFALHLLAEVLAATR